MLEKFKVKLGENMITIDSNTFDKLMEIEVTRKEKITVASRLRNPHPLISEYSPTIRESKEFNFDLSYEKTCLNIIVRKKILPRTLRIVNTLIKEMEKRDFKVSVTKLVRPKSEYYVHKSEIKPSKTCVDILGTIVEFGIEEQYDPVPVKDKNNPWSDSIKYERHPTGLLTLKIKNIYASGLRQNWREGKRRKAEDSLNSFIMGLIQAAKYLHERELERQKWKMQWRQEQIRQEEERKRIEEERRLDYDLSSRISDIKKADEIRKLVTAVKKTTSKRSEFMDTESKIGQWIQSSLDYANKLEKNAIENFSTDRTPKKKGFSDIF